MLLPARASTSTSRRAVAVDYDDRDLRDAAPAPVARTGSPTPRSPRRRSGSSVERDLVDHLTRSLAMELPVNRELKLYGRPGESAEDFAARCRQVADERADAEVAKLRDKYEAKATKLRNQIDGGHRRRRGRRGPAGGPRPRRPAVVGRLDPRRAARRAQLTRRAARPARPGRRAGAARRRPPARRVDAAQNKVARCRTSSRRWRPSWPRS